MDISVVVACYNEEAAIVESVTSALTQETDASFEVIVVDDGSSDRSFEMIEPLALQYENLFPVRLARNRGLTSATNAGIGAASGEYIVRLDGDDIFLPGLLQTLWKKRQAEKASVVIGNHLRRYVEENGRTEKVTVSKAIPSLVMCGNLIERKSFYRVGGCRPLLFEEYDLYLRLQDAGRWAFCDEALYEYRQHSASICHAEGYWRQGLEELLQIWDRDRLVRSGFGELLESNGV